MSEENKRKLGEQLIKCVLDEKLPLDIKLRKMDYIIKLGADINAKHEFGYSVLGVAKLIGKDDVISFLEERGAKETGFDKEKAEDFFKRASVEEINKVLRVLPDGYELDCDVDLSKRGLTELPDFSKIIVGGNFLCDNNQLTTLRGAPRKVGGEFNCSSNLLESLEGGPQEVGLVFDCSQNQLITLEGAPRKVGGVFNCSHNLIFSLKGAPEKVDGDFNCSNNLIFSLDEVPIIVRGNFNCRHKFINNCDKNLFEIGGNFDGYDNVLTVEQCFSESEAQFINECRKNDGKEIKGDDKAIEQLMKMRIVRAEIAFE